MLRQRYKVRYRDTATDTDISTDTYTETGADRRLGVARACVRAGWLPSGMRSQELLAGLLPFPFCRGELSLFLFGDDELSLFPSPLPPKPPIQL